MKTNLKLNKMSMLYRMYIKRLLDIVISLMALIFLSPVLILVALMIKLDSNGPIFFIQKRLGKNMKMFNIYKFRTMVPDAVKYQSIKGNLTIDNNQIVDIYAVYDKDNNLLGVVYHGTAIGYEDGTVETLVGIDIENDKFIRLRVFKTVGQTRSIGGKDVLNNFYKDFGNVDVTESVDTKAGATYSSGTVKEVIDLVSAHYQANKDEIKGLEG